MATPGNSSARALYLREVDTVLRGKGTGGNPTVLQGKNSTVPEGKSTVVRGKRAVPEGKFYRTPREAIPYLKGRITVLREKESGIKLLIINH